jgi:cold shock CspA family protein
LAILEPNHDYGHGKVVQSVKRLWIYQNGGRPRRFFHLSAVRTAGFRELRKGQKVSFEIFDNQGKAAAKNLQLNEPAEDDPEHNLNLAEMGARNYTVQHESKQHGTSGKKAHMDRARRS